MVTTDCINRFHLFTGSKDTNSLLIWGFIDIMRVLVGGATGFVGGHLRRLLKQKGHEVIAISRTPGDGKGRITWNELYGSGLPNNVQAVVNLAGENIMNPMKRWNAEFQRELHESRIDTTAALARIINKTESPPSVFISSSAVGYYKPSATAEYTEDSSPGDDHMAKLCIDWENASRLNENTPTRKVVVRIGIVLGRDGGVIKNMFVPFFMGVGGRIGSGQQWFPWIHVRDVAGIIVHAIENDHVSGVLNAVSPESANNSQFTSALAGAMWRPAIFPVPGFALNAAFGPERAKIMLEGQKVVPKRTLESGYKFVYPDLKSTCAEVGRLIYAV